MENDGQSGSLGNGQFLHVEKHSVVAPQGKAGGNTILKVANEAERVEGFCDHVLHPEVPTLVWGVGPLQAAKEAEAWARTRTEEYFHKPTNSSKRRAFRLDKASAMVGVASVPDTWEADARWKKFVARTLEWLKRKYGDDRLRSVIEHRDEGCLHLHFWVLPRADESFSAVHPGVKALEQLNLRAPRVIREAAYKKAMCHLLDEFFAEVADDFGLIRTSVHGKRYTRSQLIRKRYLDEQRELDVLKRVEVAVKGALDGVARENAAMMETNGLDKHSNTVNAVANAPENISAPMSLPLVGWDFPLTGRSRSIVIPGTSALGAAISMRTKDDDSLVPASRLIGALPRLESLLKGAPIPVRPKVETFEPIRSEQSAEQHVWLRPQGG